MSNKTDHDMIIEMHSILTNPENGVCSQLKNIKGCVYGNGKIGLRTQVYILWGAILILLVGGQDAIAILAKAVIK